MSLRYTTVIFDLDGTLLESGIGVANGFRYALDRMGLPMPETMDRRQFVGPPLRYSFQTQLGLPDDRLDEAVALYREYYIQTGQFEAEPYPGVMDLLRDLNEAGAAVCLATSKYSAIAKPMLDHFGLRPLLRYAAMSDGSELLSAKKGMLLDVLAHCPTPPGQAVMIGDTSYDAAGARDAGVPFIGVLYGYGTQAEMEAAGGRVFVRTTAELRPLLLL